MKRHPFHKNITIATAVFFPFLGAKQKSCPASGAAYAHDEKSAIMLERSEKLNLVEKYLWNCLKI